MKAEQQRPGKSAVHGIAEPLPNENSVLVHLEDLSAKFGFAHFAVMTLPGSNQERVEDNILLGNLPTEFIEAYDEMRPFKSAPLFATLRVATAPFRWSLDDEESSPASDRKSATLFDRAGLNSGFAIPLAGPDGVRAVAIFAGGTNGLNRRDLAELLLGTVEAYDALCRLRGEPRTSTARLSDREVQVLNWAANGKTSVEIATILTLSDHTVNSYLNSAMRKLDCVNRTQLVAKALRLHIIS